MSQLPHKSIIQFLPQIKHSRQRPRLGQSISLDAAADQLLVPWCCSVSHPVPADQLQPKQEDYIQRSEITAQSVAQGQFSTLHPMLWKVLWSWPHSWHTGGTFPAALCRLHSLISCSSEELQSDTASRNPDWAVSYSFPARFDTRFHAGVLSCTHLEKLQPESSFYISF